MDMYVAEPAPRVSARELTRCLDLDAAGVARIIGQGHVLHLDDFHGLADRAGANRQLDGFRQIYAARSSCSAHTVENTQEMATDSTRPFRPSKNARAAASSRGLSAFPSYS